jgi:HSP20 family protein
MTYLRQRNRLHPRGTTFPALGWLQHEMNRLFEATPRGSAAPGPAVTVHETDLAYEARFLVPGADSESLAVAVEGDVLRVSGERAGIPEGAHRTGARERSAGSFARSLEFPAPVDAEHVAARYRDGILHVTLPKAEAARARTIDITFADDQE